jgi:hypothetical protein
MTRIAINVSTKVYIYQLHIYSLLSKHQRKMSSPASGSKPKMNFRSTAVKRIMQEASELATTDANDDFVAAPLEVRHTGGD